MDDMVESPCRPEGHLTGRRNMAKSEVLNPVGNIRKKGGQSIRTPLYITAKVTASTTDRFLSRAMST